MVCFRKEDRRVKDTFVATGIEFSIDGDFVWIEFYGEDGQTFHYQPITLDALEGIPVLALAARAAVAGGPDAAQEVLDDAERSGLI